MAAVCALSNFLKAYPGTPDMGGHDRPTLSALLNAEQWWRRFHCITVSGKIFWLIKIDFQQIKIDTQKIENGVL